MLQRKIIMSERYWFTKQTRPTWMHVTCEICDVPQQCTIKVCGQTHRLVDFKSASSSSSESSQSLSVKRGGYADIVRTSRWGSYRSNSDDKPLSFAIKTNPFSDIFASLHSRRSSQFLSLAQYGNVKVGIGYQFVVR